MPNTPYQLTLTSNERRAIDWVGHRYAHGDELGDVLTDAVQVGGEEWDSPADITFHLEEHQGWAIREIGMANYNDEEGENPKGEFRWDCFAPALVRKLTILCDNIV